MVREEKIKRAFNKIKISLWEIDIPSPTVPEYIEHHEQVTEVLNLVKELERKLLSESENELDKLEQYLIENKIPYERFDEETNTSKLNRHQIIVYDNFLKQTRLWDAICHYGSYGYKEGLLEVMGRYITYTDDDVEGGLTADDIIRRLDK